MFKNRSLQAKIISGFLLIIAFVVIVGGVGYRGIGDVGEALHIVGDEEAPLVDAAMEMKISLAHAMVAMEEFKGASAALASDNEEELDGIVKRYEQSLAEFDTFADAILEGKTFEDGSVIIKTDNNELGRLVRQANEIHDEKYQGAATQMMQGGRDLLKKVAEAKAAMEAMEEVFDEVVSDSGGVEEMISAEIAKRASDGNIGEEAQAILREEIPLADMAMEAKMALAETRLALEEFVQTRDLSALDDIEKEYKQKIDAFDVHVMAILNGGEVDGTVVVATDNEEVRAAVKEMDENHTQFQENSANLMALHRAAIAQAVDVEEAMVRMDAAGEEADRLLSQVEEAAGEEMAAAKADGNAAHRTAITVMISVTVVAVVLGIIIGLLLSNSITRPFKEIFKGLKSFSAVELKDTANTFTRIIEGMTDSVAQVNDAAGQVSSASQQLAEGASEQASSLEETSSALEQMSAMTRTNAANAKEANDLATQSHKDADNGNVTMTAISESSNQISKIIKVIEEIAFQTNLLALNAAVEAARAGEHGKGFAVVADEVRNLAQRAAQASREITGLIDNSVSKSREGTDAIQAIVTGVAKVTELINGIAKASDEQAQGVDQVNTAVSQMDKVTQQNASGAEESASAAEELSAQAEATKGLVDELIVLVRGEEDHRSMRPTPQHAGAGQHMKKRLDVHVAHVNQATPATAHPKPQPVSTAAGGEHGSSKEFMSLADNSNLKEF